ncbi:MAG: hypothetical protein SV186_03180 [Candidatus Nanohaloarchaea archaeon]|nr:hypothetical protein [Candidatus Nanohaloarchaea archaeon]
MTDEVVDRAKEMLSEGRSEQQVKQYLTEKGFNETVADEIVMEASGSSGLGDMLSQDMSFEDIKELLGKRDVQIGIAAIFFMFAVIAFAIVFIA